MTLSAYCAHLFLKVCRHGCCLIWRFLISCQVMHTHYIKNQVYLPGVSCNKSSLSNGTGFWTGEVEAFVLPCIPTGGLRDVCLDSPIAVADGGRTRSSPTPSDPSAASRLISAGGRELVWLFLLCWAWSCRRITWFSNSSIFRCSLSAAMLCWMSNVSSFDWKKSCCKARRFHISHLSKSEMQRRFSSNFVLNTYSNKVLHWSAIKCLLLFLPHMTALSCQNPLASLPKCLASPFPPG